MSERGIWDVAKQTKGLSNRVISKGWLVVEDGGRDLRKTWSCVHTQISKIKTLPPKKKKKKEGRFKRLRTQDSQGPSSRLSKQ